MTIIKEVSIIASHREHNLRIIFKTLLVVSRMDARNKMPFETVINNTLCLTSHYRRNTCRRTLI